MPDEDLTQIPLGRFQVGIAGLQAAIEELKDWRGRPDAEIAQALGPAQDQELYPRFGSRRLSGGISAGV